jgi:hypothetical protein
MCFIVHVSDKDDRPQTRPTWGNLANGEAEGRLQAKKTPPRSGGSGKDGSMQDIHPAHITFRSNNPLWQALQPAVQETANGVLSSAPTG